MRLEGARLRERRRARGMTQEDLAKAAAATVRTVQRAERGEDVSPTTAGFLAEALGTSVEALQAPTSSERTAERLRRAAHAAKPGDRVDTRHGAATLLGPRELENVYASPRSYDGELFVLDAHLASQRAGADDETAALGCDEGLLAAFQCRVTARAADGKPYVLDVTVHAFEPGVTRALQARLGATARIVSRVVVRPGTRALMFFESPRGHSWTFVALSAGGPERDVAGAAGAVKKGTSRAAKRPARRRG